LSREVRRLGTATSHCSAVIVDIKVSTKLFHLTSRCPLHTVPEAIVADATSSGLHGRRLLQWLVHWSSSVAREIDHCTRPVSNSANQNVGNDAT